MDYNQRSKHAYFFFQKRDTYIYPFDYEAIINEEKGCQVKTLSGVWDQLLTMLYSLFEISFSARRLGLMVLTDLTMP